MQGLERSAEKTRILNVTSLELKQLLILLSTKRNIRLRFKQTGGKWMKNYMKVDAVKDKSVLLYDDSDGRYYLLKINNIMQFDIDATFQTYQPGLHYTVTPSAELD
jgi:hypothetical protein